MSDYDANAVPARLAFAVGRLNRRLVGATGGLSHGLLSALATIAKSGPMRLADVAQIENVSAPSVTRVIAELESRGLVARNADATDGRAFLIQVTDAGMEAVVLARAARAQATKTLLEILDESELAALEAALPALERVVGQV
jgi:DNA-binding MarR family transcriptional regulator